MSDPRQVKRGTIAVDETCNVYARLSGDQSSFDLAVPDPHYEYGFHLRHWKRVPAYQARALAELIQKLLS